VASDDLAKLAADRQPPTWTATVRDQECVTMPNGLISTVDAIHIDERCCGSTILL